MLPIIVAGLSMAQKKAQSEDERIKQMQQQNQNSLVQGAQPSINSIFGQR